MSTGLIALLDDIASIAKVAAASLDDIAAQAGKAGAKAAGVVIDDAAVTPRYVVGFAADREVPIVRRIAIGSLRNKLVFLLPAALALSAFAPWSITPLLMLGGVFLCYEGAEKVWEMVSPHAAHAHEAEIGAAPADPQALEEAKIAGAIKTDFVLSAEIMAIALATIPEAGFWMQAATLALVGIGITVVVYGAVALIVKADDAGLALARADGPSARLPAGLAMLSRGLGRGLVKGMPPFLKLLGIVGTAAMVWVGGGILIHGAEEFGVTAPGRVMHAAEHAAGFLGGAVVSGIVGMVVGAVIIPLVSLVAKVRR